MAKKTATFIQKLREEQFYDLLVLLFKDKDYATKINYSDLTLTDPKFLKGDTLAFKTVGLDSNYTHHIEFNDFEAKYERRNGDHTETMDLDRLVRAYLYYCFGEEYHEALKEHITETMYDYV
ncbi:MAG: hypothetical protein E7359_03835 [Clostridiales bacterium]|nr:hypothetical protein [Clostridiales bacterium]